MARFITLLCILFLFATAVYAQSDTAFKDFVIVNNNIWALTTGGAIKIFDLGKGGLATDKTIRDNAGITAIAKDKNESIVIAAGKEIKRNDEKNNSWEVIANSDSVVIGIVFTNKNVCYGITQGGIENLSKNNLHISYAEINGDNQSWQKFNTNPACYFMDKDNNIWVGFGHGEWGGHICVFKTGSKKYFGKTASLPVKSFFEDPQYVYSSSGLSHMMYHGEIDRFDDFKPTTVFQSESKGFQPGKINDKIHAIDGEYIGPATYNAFNNSIYFYSQNGIFRCDISKDLSKISSWENILQPSLNWKYGQPDAVVYQMNVLKIMIIDKNRFAFLTQSDGIGYFDGEKLTMLK